jgi:hypothetical protein
VDGVDQSRIPAQRRDMGMEQLELVGLASEAAKYPHQMSGGRQQRVALADEDVIVYSDRSNSAVPIGTGSAVEVTLTERAVMVADRTVAQSAPATAPATARAQGAGRHSPGHAPGRLSASVRSRGHDAPERSPLRPGLLALNWNGFY